MPELPEVETIVRDLRKFVLGRRIQDAWSNVPKFQAKIIPPAGGPARGLAKSKIIGSRIEDIKRRGKNILFLLDNKKILLVHQKMTGHLMYGEWKKRGNSWKSVKAGPLRDDKMNSYIRLIFKLDNGKMIALSDLRKFARVEVFDAGDVNEIDSIKKLGPDALEIKFTNFKKIILEKKKTIKQVLLDQNVIAGIGNIYADEILWNSCVHPQRKPLSLSDGELRRLFRFMKYILKKAVKMRGTSTSDFRDTAGKKGRYGDVLSIYRKEKEPCLRCKTKIKRIKVGGRSSCFCPKCQALDR